MSSYITIEARLSPETPGDLTEESLLRLLAEHTGADNEPDELTVTAERAFVGWTDRKWGVQGADDAARALSSALPYARVTWEEEWDNRDADEAGGESRTYRRGQLTRTGRIGWIHEDVS